MSHDPASPRPPTPPPVEEAGDRRAHAAADLLPAVYVELRRLAAAQLARLRPGQTLQPTALVHEAYMKLVGQADPGWDGRRHFFGAAAEAMRELLVDHVRRKGAQKRGGGRAPESLEDSLPIEDGDPRLDDVLAVDAALTRLEAEHPRKARVAIMRYFGGLSDEEIAEGLGITTRTVERDWRFARAYLVDALQHDVG
ncbi:MAG: sigma-70 family RNA polymerase sigma factor [Minicystis sp.]